MVSQGGGLWLGLQRLYERVPEKFDMILDPSHPEYKNLPGIGVLVGGMWVANLYYWGFNQYIIQRTLAAKSLKESQKGIMMAAFLKMIIPLVVVVPGIAAYVITRDSGLMSSLGVSAISKPDEAYPWLLQFLPMGLKGIAFAALGRGHCFFFGVNAQFYFYHLYNGHLQTTYQPQGQ